jgi:pimeloyl-ACP methyl ester carboxylesterase
MMRLAAKRRTQWTNSCQLRLGEQQSILLKAGLVEVSRVGTGDPIVLVPGLAGGMRLLAPLARRLARHHEVILYNLRGDSSPTAAPHARRLGDYADDLAELVERLQLERPTIFGVSFGGAVALEMATERPERVGALVLQGVEARYRTCTGSLIARRVLERFPLPKDNRFLNQFFNLLHGGKPEPGPLVDFVVETCWETDQSVMAHRLESLEAFDVSERLWRLDVPTLVLAGTRDVIVPLARQRELAGAIPAARFRQIEGAGHIAFLTHQAEVTRHIDHLLSDSRRMLC